jgi:formylglycine-generating enzyme required for sulfatase activity
MAWYKKNSDGKLHPVGQKKPNAWGLYDMYGNAQEWVMDYFHFGYDGAPTDGSARLTKGETDFRTIRGGSCNYDVDYINRREELKPDAKVLSTGFRVEAVPQSK